MLIADDDFYDDGSREDIARNQVFFKEAIDILEESDVTSSDTDFQLREACQKLKKSEKAVKEVLVGEVIKTSLMTIGDVTHCRDCKYQSLANLEIYPYLRTPLLETLADGYIKQRKYGPRHFSQLRVVFVFPSLPGLGKYHYGDRIYFESKIRNVRFECSNIIPSREMYIYLAEPNELRLVEGQ
ncbi:hypothetical protein CH368_17275 [Leptospira levettii]|nr:hypothetical protein CH368_17275 [Leptospira levettii]